MTTLPAGPLISEAGMADPHALVSDGTCYLFTGHDVGFGVGDWVMPDWRIYASTNLCDWDHVGSIDPSDTYMGAGNTHCWAGDIVARNGRYWWYFSNHNKETGVMVADSPTGPWQDALGGPLVDSFDPSIFIDDDDTAYIVYGHGDYFIAPLDDNMTALADKPRLISIDRGDTFPVMDKNSLHKHNGIYYLSCSGYYATAINVMGPYTYQGLVGTGWGLDTPFGHGDFFKWQGSNYHVWCRYRNREHDRIRDCFLAPTVYSSDGLMTDQLDHLDPALLPAHPPT